MFNWLSYINYNLYVCFEYNSLNWNIFLIKGIWFFLEFKGLWNGGYEVSGFNFEVGLNRDLLFFFRLYIKFSFWVECFLLLSSRGLLKFSVFVGLVINFSNIFGDFFLVGVFEVFIWWLILFYGLNINYFVV